MLRHLRIRNLAVIESAEVEFEPGFNVLTGETGAGKSMLVEAVGLLLGGRASADLVRTGESQATIEALFVDLAGDELVVRRELTSQGRSRSFVDGSLATAAGLREIARKYVELHGQHEHQALLDPLTHLPTLDEYAALGETAARVSAQWNVVRSLRERWERAGMDAREKTARLELIDFQLGEIDKVGPRAGEDDQLHALKHVLASADRVRRLCEESYAALYDGDHAALASLGAVWKRLGELGGLDAQFAPYVDARDGIKSQLEDLAFFLRSYAEGIDASPGRLQQVEDRLAQLERLRRKYGPTVQDVIARAESLRQERTVLGGADEQSETLRKELDDATAAYVAEARALSTSRRTAAARFARELEALLGELAMPQAAFEVRFDGSELPPEAWSERGIDRAEFFLSANPGEELRPLTRIVSGGELSRIMLALKALTATSSDSSTSARGKTLIFDEVDAGIGGRVADVVGLKLRQLGRSFQVLCITHLPQIAAQAATQFLIEKRVERGRTTTSVERLDGEARVGELARMIGGTAVTEAVRSSARDLLSRGVAAGGPSLDRANTGRKAKAKVESETPPRR